MDKKKGISKGVILSVVLIVIVVLAIIGIAFYIESNKPQIIEQVTLDGGNVTLTYTDDENLFMIENSGPTSDSVGMSYDSADKYFDFTVKTELIDAEYIEYEIVLIKDTEKSTSLDSDIKIYLEREDSGTYTKVSDPVVFSEKIGEDDKENSSLVVYKIKKKASESDNYRLRMWVSDTAAVAEGHVQNYAVKVSITGEAK